MRLQVERLEQEIHQLRAAAYKGKFETIRLRENNTKLCKENESMKWFLKMQMVILFIFMIFAFYVSLDMAEEAARQRASSIIPSMEEMLEEVYLPPHTEL